MNIYYLLPAVLLVFLGLAHSVLGERLILTRLHDLPAVLGSREFTRRTLRFVWHITTVLLFVVAGVLLLAPSGTVAALVAAGCALCAVIAGVISHGKHFSWGVFLVCAILIWFGS